MKMKWASWRAHSRGDPYFRVGRSYVKVMVDENKCEENKASEAESSRRRFLKQFLKAGLYAGPVIYILFDPNQHAVGKKMAQHEMDEVLSY